MRWCSGTLLVMNPQAPELTADLTDKSQRMSQQKFSRTMVDQFAAIPGATLRTNLEPELSAGVIKLALNRGNTASAYDALWKRHRIAIAMTVLGLNLLDTVRASISSAGISRIYLVTHAWHMPRAQAAFEYAGFAVIPAPTGYAVKRNRPPEDFVPSADGFVLSAHFCHEVLGAIWYRLKRHWITGSS